jgi:hypothetical protein
MYRGNVYMTPSDFCVWLDGFLSVDRSTKNLPYKELLQIKEKLLETKQQRPLPFIPYYDPKTPPLMGDGLRFDFNPGYNSDFGSITCQSGPGGSG